MPKREKTVPAPWLEEAMLRFPELEEHLKEQWEMTALCSAEAAELSEAELLNAGDLIPAPPLLERARKRFDNPHSLWIESNWLFDKAWEADPPNRSLIDRIYAFSDWCVAQPEGKTAEDDLVTVVCVCFLEHIPTIPAALRDMPNRFTWDEVETSRYYFSYLVGEKGFEAIRQAYKNPGGEAGRILAKPRRRRP